ncbi:hypothetical protein KCU81_g3897, partial [Aureobasidium melanogenum]|uniref:Uncharacterized protein n=1 Tax=Aureobasidium melanogenum (strain CBS 110374) TaxID=1043003 RepID=A0A074VPB0_AURM1
MAGNPFRKSQFLSLDVSAAREAAGLEASQSPPVATSTSTQAKTKGKVQKKVRIQSPVISPDSPAAYRDQHDPFDSYLNPVGQPALPTTEEQDIDVARELRKSFIDSLARGATVPNREASQPAAPIAPPIAAAPAQSPAQAPVPAPERMETSSQSGQQAPYNPFARTLATIDPQNAASAPVGLSRDTSAASAKPAMDVDAFTRMLLTGNTPSASPGPMTPSAGLPSAATNSLGDLHPESPPASDDDEHHDGPPEPDYEQLTGLVRTPNTHSKKSKPPPPAHHHGKALSTPNKGPQTVSFADFDVSATPPALPSPSIASPKPQLARSPSDLNKPLPPPPPPHHSPSPDKAPSISEQFDGPAQSPQLPAEDFSISSKRPPPIPLSRRSSQMRSSSGRPRSSSNLSRSSIPDDYSDGTATPPVKPPPPPARRGPHSVETDLPAPSARPPLPPPPRHTKQRPASISRTPSTNSTHSLNKANMPPPPPPRRGENKRRSLDGTLLSASVPSSRRMSDTSRRSSGASIYSVGGRAPSISSIPTVDEGDSGEDRSFTATPQPQTPHVGDNGAGSATTGGHDILADMNAMQAEIDALMARSKGGS